MSNPVAEMTDLIAPTRVERFNRGMAMQMASLLREHRSFDLIPQEKRELYVRRTEEQEEGELVTVIVPKRPKSIPDALQELQREGFLDMWEVPAEPRPMPAYARGVAKRVPTTMDDFWRNMRWFTKDSTGRIASFTPGRWRDSPVEVHYAAVRHLYTRVLRGKDPRDASSDDLNNNKLRQLLRLHDYNLYELISGAFPEMKIQPWEMLYKPRRLFDDIEVCRAAVRWLADVKLQVDPTALTKEDFRRNRLATMLYQRYNDSPYAAIADAYPERKFSPVGKRNAPKGTYAVPENRLEYIRQVARQVSEETGKEGRDLTARELRRLSGVLSRYYGNNYSAMLLDAGVIAEADVAYVQSRRNGPRAAPIGGDDHAAEATA